MVGVGLAATALVGWLHRARPLEGLALAVVVAVSTWLSVIDFREHRLPNRIVGPLAVAITVVIGLGGLAEDDLGRAGRAMAFGLVASTVLLVANLIGGLGMGDVKYGYPVAATVGWFGWDALAVTILVTAFSGGLVGAVLLAIGRGRNYALSYGPFMALGLVAGLVAAGTVQSG